MEAADVENISCEAGVATYLLRTINDWDEFYLSASAKGLKTGVLPVTIKK